MRWKKESNKAKNNKRFVDSRLKRYASKPLTPTKKESIEDFLKRGGKIIYIAQRPN